MHGGPAQPDVVALSGAAHLEDLGKTLAWMRWPMEKDRSKVGRELRQEEEEETEGKERRKGRRPRLASS